jgi:hypothetical protein
MTSQRRPAAASRVLLAGLSAAATLGLVAAMGAAGATSSTTVGVSAGTLRVVVTDARIDTNVAVAAARQAVRAGRTVAQVPIGAAQPAARGGFHAAHTQTRSS